MGLDSWRKEFTKDDPGRFERLFFQPKLWPKEAMTLSASGCKA
jgi:hypothetical protein